MNMVNEQLYLQVKGKWKSIYPIYFDSSKTLKQGRRLAKETCIPNPTLQQLAKAVCMCQLRNIIQPYKAYPRDYFMLGRMKVQLLKENGQPVHQSIPSKNILLQKIAHYLRLLRQK